MPDRHSPQNALRHLIQLLKGDARADYLFRALWVEPLLTDIQGHEPFTYSRSELAQALNMLLFDDLLERVPLAAVYTEEKMARGEQVMLDHGALRTVAFEEMALPGGHQAFSRLLGPLGYRLAGRYPLEDLGMCGFVYCHLDLPETLSQFFVSELYPDKFSETFQEAVARVLADSVDPIQPQHQQLLARLSRDGKLPQEEALQLLPALMACFGRQHPLPTFADYQQLLGESREMAWIATEGNVFNHATDRVSDLDSVVTEQREKQRPMKPAIEEGQHARIRQTAYRAHTVERQFSEDEGQGPRPVPGSFFEFIQRGPMPEDPGRLDLRFDSRNAQGIFTMTRH